MALGKGIGIMSRGSVDLDTESLARREKLAEELYASSIVPKAPEQSWSQGAARMAQALMAGKQLSEVEEDKKAYKQQQVAGMASLLSGNGSITPEVASSLPPNQQIYALQLMQQKRQKADDMESQLKMKKAERALDPVNAIKDEIYEWQQAMQDPELPDYLRPEVEKKISQLATSMSAMKPSKTTVNVDASQKAEDAGLKKRKELLEEDAVKKEAEVGQAGLGAEDSSVRMQGIQDMIENGELNNQNTTNFGQAVEKGLARVNAPNDSAAIGTFLQSAKQQLVDARKQLAGQGQVSNYEGKLLEATVLNAEDTIETVRSKLFVYQQVYQRQKELAQIQNEWIKRYGSTTNMSENGKNFREVVTKMYQQKPLVSYADAMRKKAEAASGQAIQQNMGESQ